MKADHKLVAVAASAVVASLAAAGVTSASGAASSPRDRIATSVRREQVGPQGTPTRSAALPLVEAGGTSQVVSGVVQSTSAVAVSPAGNAVYSGTEPGTMTLARHGRDLVVTVEPH